MTREMLSNATISEIRKMSHILLIRLIQKILPISACGEMGQHSHTTVSMSDSISRMSISRLLVGSDPGITSTVINAIIVSISSDVRDSEENRIVFLIKSILKRNGKVR